jgi:chromosome segregation ATPase
VKRGELQNALQKVNELMDISVASTYDIKIHKRIQDKLNHDIKELEDQKVSLKKQLDDLASKFEKTAHEKRVLSTQVDAQSNETIIAQTVVEHLNKRNNSYDLLILEIQSFQKLNRNVVNQWEDALSAMKKRDATLQKLQKAYAEKE